jgi:hypothetical protein
VQALAGVASEFDTDGVDVLFLNYRGDPTHPSGKFKILAGQPVRPELDRRGITPNGATPLGRKMRLIMSAFEGQLCPQVPHDHHHIGEQGRNAFCVNQEQPVLKKWGCPFQPPSGFPRRESYEDGSRTVFCSGGSGFNPLDQQRPSKRNPHPITPGPGVLKPLNLVVLTDGEASDPDLVHLSLQHYVHFCHVSAVP